MDDDDDDGDDDGDDNDAEELEDVAKRRQVGIAHPRPPVPLFVVDALHLDEAAAKEQESRRDERAHFFSGSDGIDLRTTSTPLAGVGKELDDDENASARTDIRFIMARFPIRSGTTPAAR